MRPGLVFVTRKFPPSVGGMQTLASHVWQCLSTTGSHPVLVAHGGGNRWLPLWIPYAVLRIIWLVGVRRVRRVLVGDALAHIALRPVLGLLGATDVCMVMGLDVTYQLPLYQRLLRRTLPKADHVLAISSATAVEAEGIGVPPGRLSIVRLGVEAPVVAPADRCSARVGLHRLVGLEDDALLVGTVGRLARRKGAAWFSEHVLPSLPERVHYVVAGAGQEHDAIVAATERAGVRGRVHLLGRVDDATRETVMRGVDVFVLPNVRVAGDMEGFGLVSIEAAMRGTPVLAACLEGLVDAVVDGRTGDLVPPEDARAWVRSLDSLLADRVALEERGARYGAAARELYGVEQMGRTILAALQRR